MMARQMACNAVRFVARLESMASVCLLALCPLREAEVDRGTQAQSVHMTVDGAVLAMYRTLPWQHTHNQETPPMHCNNRPFRRGLVR